ncbi:MAG: hypothetical protein LQ347_004548 [Umbilicaria vellea]|nr:MAG: hypothetical protein LQ347_004548 [Umbilicaria vellea]
MALVSPKSRPVTHIATQLYNYAVDFSTNPKHLRWLAPLLIVADASLCALIIWKIPYTEIDWKSYMQQVAQFVSGERDYVLIKGDTGSLVYPAAHLYVYSALYYITDEGRNIDLAQYVFGGLYLAVLSVVMACYRLASVGNPFRA